MWKKRKAIDGVSQSSMVPLKAVLYEREESMKTGSVSGADEQAAKRRKTDVLQSNPGVAERSARDQVNVDRGQILQEKAELYSQIVEQGESTDGNGLLDLERKRWQTEDQHLESQDTQSSHHTTPVRSDHYRAPAGQAEHQRVLVALSDDTDSKRSELKADRVEQENAAIRRREALKKREQLKQQQQQQQQQQQEAPITRTSLSADSQPSSVNPVGDTVMTDESKVPITTTTTTTTSTPTPTSSKLGVLGAIDGVRSSPRDDSPGVVSLKSPTPPTVGSGGAAYMGSGGRHRLGGQNPVTSPPPLITTSGRRGNANASSVGAMHGEMGGGKLTAGVPFVLTAGKVSPARRRSLRHIQMAHHGPSLVGSESACDTSMESLSPTRAMRSATSSARRHGDNTRASLSPVDDLVRRPQPGSSPLVRSALAKHNEEMEGRKRGEETSGAAAGLQAAPTMGAGAGTGTGTGVGASGAGEEGKKEGGGRHLASPPASSVGTMGSPPQQWTHPSWPPMRREDSASHMSMSSNMADNIDSLLGKTVNDLFGGAPFAPPIRRKRRGIVDAGSRPAAPPRATPSKVLQSPRGREVDADSAGNATAMSISTNDGDGQARDAGAAGAEPDQV